MDELCCGINTSACSLGCIAIRVPIREAIGMAVRSRLGRHVCCRRDAACLACIVYIGLIPTANPKTREWQGLMVQERVETGLYSVRMWGNMHNGRMKIIGAVSVSS